MLTTIVALLTPLTVVVEGIDTDQGGQLYVTVQNEEQFMRQASVAGSVETPTSETMTFTYEIEPGSYVVSIWHDEEGNGVFDRKSDGWPDDGWGMTGPGGVKFDDGKIDIGSSEKTVTIEMVYPD